MRLVSYRRGPEGDGSWRAGVARGELVVDAAQAAAAAGLDTTRDWSSMRALIAAPAAERAALADAAASADGMPREQLELGPPVPDPDKILCIGLNYRDHAAEANLPLPEVPMLFAKFRNSLVGPSADVALPADSKAVDYEAELAVVIGTRAKGVEAERALEHVAGAMAFNDLTARDVQHQTSQWTAGKAVDDFGPCGPELVTLDELGDPHALRIGTRVNGKTVQDGTTADMIFSIADTIAFVSRLMTLEPGDIICTGTPAGVGFKRDPQVLLADGDVVEVEVEGIGVLRNRMVGGTA